MGDRLPPLTDTHSAFAAPLPAPSLRDSNRLRSAVPRLSSDPVTESGPPSLSLEPVPGDRLPSFGNAITGEPRPHDAKVAEPLQPVPPVRRGLLGRFGPPPLSRSMGDDPIRVAPRSDPAAEAALQRRVEHQIRIAAGPQLRSVNVRVAGRTADVQARVFHFWQKRFVRRLIETLPQLRGYQTRIDVTD